MHLVLLLFALFASLFTMQKEALNYAYPFFLIGSRMLFAGLLLLFYYFTRLKKKIRFTPSLILALTMLTLSNIYLTNIFEIWGINRMVSSKACLLYSLSPFLAAFIAYITIGEKLNSSKWLGMLIGFCGLIPILYTQTETEIYSGQVGLFSYAELAILGAVICSVFGWIQLKKISQMGCSFIFANGFSMLFGGILAITHSYISGEPWHPIPIISWQPFIIFTASLCAVSNIICYNLYGYLLKKFSATFMSFAGLITPIFASLFGWIFLNERITWHFFMSITLFFIGLSIFYHQELIKSDLNTGSQGNK